MQSAFRGHYVNSYVYDRHNNGPHCPNALTKLTIFNNAQLQFSANGFMSRCLSSSLTSVTTAATAEAEAAAAAQTVIDINQSTI
jgi:hypothetical protein